LKIYIPGNDIKNLSLQVAFVTLIYYKLSKKMKIRFDVTDINRI